MADQLAAFNLCEPDFDQAVKSISAAGFRQIALYFSPGLLPCGLESMTEADARALKSKLDEHGLKPIAAGGGSNVMTEEGLETLVGKLDAAGMLGVPAFDTGSLSTKGKDAATIERETATFCDNMARAADAAEDRGITICLETHGGLTGTVPSCLWLMARLAHPRVKIGYDPANIVFYEGASPLDQLAALVPYIGHVHAKDQIGGKDAANFPTVGKGEVPYPDILRTLLSGGYAGCISVERAYADTPEQRANEIKDAYAFLRQYVD